MLFGLFGCGGKAPAAPGESSEPRSSVPLTQESSSVQTTGAPSAEAPVFAGELTFSSFDGGGPEFTAAVEDPTVLTFKYQKRYSSPRHREMTGAPFTAAFTFRGLKPGESRVTVRAISPITGTAEYVYLARVDEALAVTLTQTDGPVPAP